MYQPRPVPPDMADLPAFLQQELMNIARASLEGNQFLSLSIKEPYQREGGSAPAADGPADDFEF